MARIERDRQGEIRQAIDLAANDCEGGSAAYLIRTVSEGAYPATAVASYAVVTIGVDGSEAEGSTPSFVDQGAGTTHAYNVGSTVPPVGSYALAHGVGGRLVFRWDS